MKSFSGAKTKRNSYIGLISYILCLGEPIMYPKINDLVRLLHNRGISTFLVTNAQFPDAIKYV